MAKALDYLTTKSLSYGKTIGLPVPESKKATDIGLLYVSAPVYQVLLELRKKPMLNPEHEPRFDVYEQEYEKHDSAMKEIISIASKDLYLNTPLLTGLLQRIKQGMK